MSFKDLMKENDEKSITKKLFTQSNVQANTSSFTELKNMKITGQLPTQYRKMKC